MVTRQQIVCGDIGEGQREIEFDPIREPITVPSQPEPAPV